MAALQPSQLMVSASYRFISLKSSILFCTASFGAPWVSPEELHLNHFSQQSFFFPFIYMAKPSQPSLSNDRQRWLHSTSPTAFFTGHSVRKGNSSYTFSTPIPYAKFSALIKVCTKNNYFVYGESIYQ